MRQVTSHLIHHAHIIELLVNGDYHTHGFMKPDYMLNLNSPVPGQTGNRDSAQSVKGEVKVGVIDSIHQVQEEEVTIL